MNSGATVVGTGAIVVDTGSGMGTGTCTIGATVVGTGTSTGNAFWTKP